MSAPEIAVVVPSHDRPGRLAALLDALAAQTLDRGRWEAVVCHDSSGPQTQALLEAHELARSGTLRAIELQPGPGPAAKRNRAWRASAAPVIAFTDDDCRPPADWLERALAAARANPDAIVQGATAPDPREEHLLGQAALPRTQRVDPPGPWAQTCNIVYPRQLLERLGGFDERLPAAAGEDTDLALRARGLGAAFVGAPEVRTFHAVDALSVRQAVRIAWRWRHLALVARRHPEVRQHIPYGLFWKRSHPLLLLALLGLAAAPRRRAGLLLVLPWLRYLQRTGGLRTLPARAAVDAAEFAAMAAGSARYRTVLL